MVLTGRDQARGDAVVAQIAAGGGQASFVACRPRRRSGVHTARGRHRRRRLGGLTVLVNNAAAAGRGRRTGRRHVTTKRGRTHSCAPPLPLPCGAARAAIPHMQRAGHGSIVNMSSRQAERASKGFAAYIAREVGPERADPRDRGRLRRARHPLQHDQPRLRAQRPARRRHHARARTPRYEGMHLTRLGAAADVWTRPCTSRAASRSSSPGSTSSSTAAAASPAACRSDEHRESDASPCLCQRISTFGLALDEDLEFWARHGIAYGRRVGRQARTLRMGRGHASSWSTRSARWPARSPT